MEMMMITEVEMREFFDRVVQQVNQLTGTAQQVEGLQTQVNDLHQRISNLEADNAELRRQLTEAQYQVANWQRNSDQANEAARQANEQIVGLRDTIVQRDSTVVELNGQIKSETDAHRITRADLDDARRAISEWETKYNQANDAFISASVERDEWRNRANSLDRDNAELKSKLDGISAMLNPPAFHVVGGDGSGQAQVG